MHKKKKVKTIIVEKYKYDNDDNDDYGITVAPELLLKLLEYAHTQAKSDEELHAIVTRAHILSHNDDDSCLYMEHYPMLITNAIVPTVEVVEVPTGVVEPTPAV